MSTKDIESLVSYRTKDMELAAFMWCQTGAKLVEIMGGEERGVAVFFHFSLPIPEEDLRQLLFAHANGDTLVDPLAFCARLSKLRDMLHATLSKYKRVSNAKRR